MLTSPLQITQSSVKRRNFDVKSRIQVDFCVTVCVNIILSCRSSSGEPPATLSWSRAGSADVIAEGETLELDPVEVADEGATTAHVEEKLNAW